MLPRFAHCPNLSTPGLIASLSPRNAPYWNILEYGRSIGLEKPPHTQGTFWVARVRKKNGSYRQQRLCSVVGADGAETSLEMAVALARAWYARPEIEAIANRSFPVGTSVALRYVSKGEGFTVGDALHDYVEWKRIAAAWSHFTTALSLINCHLVPRLAYLRASDLTGLHIRDLCVDLLETPPRRGNRQLGPKVPIADLPDDALRKRKKTLNTVLGILRVALQMAWENGKVESDRAWRCIRNVPTYDAPRAIALTRDECRRLLAACRPDLRLFVQAALYTGCRSSELARLRVRDVGGHVYGIYVNRAKGYRARHVFLPDEGMSFFLRHCAGKDPDHHVFASGSGRSWRDTQYRHLFKDAVRAACLPDAFCFHGLRHTYASQLVQAGASLQSVARQLGHATIDTVMRTYGHLAPTIQADEVMALFSALDPGELASAAIRKPALDAIRQSLQADAQDGLPLDTPRRAWPRANHFRGSVLE